MNSKINAQMRDLDEECLEFVNHFTSRSKEILSSLRKPTDEWHTKWVKHSFILTGLKMLRFFLAGDFKGAKHLGAICLTEIEVMEIEVLRAQDRISKDKYVQLRKRARSRFDDACYRAWGPPPSTAKR